MIQTITTYQLTEFWKASNANLKFLKSNDEIRPCLGINVL